MNRVSFVAAGMSAVMAAAVALPAFALDGQASVDVNLSTTVNGQKTETRVNSGVKADAKAKAKANAEARKKIDHTCVQGHVATRESALIAGWTTFNTNMTAAYTTRKTSLNTAWGKADATERKAAVRASWDAFKKSKKAAVRGWNDTRKSAWKTFRTNIKNCNAGAEAAVEMSADSSDNL